MILFTRLNRGAIAVNPDLIERAESTPDTVITFVDDKKLLVAEPLDEVIRLITDYRAYVIARSRDLQVVEHPNPSLHVVPSDTVVTGYDSEPS
jgi:flagellar protein FlbD